MPPKRQVKEKIERYKRKIQELTTKNQRKRRRIIFSDSSDEERNSDSERENEAVQGNLQNEPPIPSGEGREVSPVPSIEDQEAIPALTGEEQEVQNIATEPELDSEVLLALGESTDETPKYGPKLHEKLARLWLPLLKKGMEKEAKDKLIKQYPVPENCVLLNAPKLNPEISAAISDATRARDKRVENVQQQLGAGITALNRGLKLLLEDNKDRLQAVKFLSESSRLLCDLHFTETAARKKFITTGLDKAFLNVVQEVDRDEMLFGNKLSEKIKASKMIEKQGLQIKKVTPAKVTTPSAQAQPSTSRTRFQGNWSGPPRYPTNKGGRGAPRKTAPAGRGPPPAAQSKSTEQSKQRAPYHRR